MEVSEVIAKGRSSLICAIKRKNQNVNESPIVVKICSSPRLKREKNLLEKLTHQNVIRVLGYEERMDQSFMFMERALGKDLFEQLNHFQSLPESIAQKVFLQIVDGVKFLHEKNVAHRDLKLENILIMEKVEEMSDLESRTIKLADFEFANHFTPQQKCFEKMGTEYYYSPQLISGEYSPFKADIWALGVILYALLTGKYPTHIGPNTDILTDKYLPSEITDSLRDLLKLLLSYNEENRPNIHQVLSHPWLTSSLFTSDDNPFTKFLEFWKTLFI